MTRTIVLVALVEYRAIARNGRLIDGVLARIGAGQGRPRLLPSRIELSRLACAPLRPPREKVNRHIRDRKTLHITRGAGRAKVTTHGMHYRAQPLNMLRQLGVQPLPRTSVTEWT